MKLLRQALSYNHNRIALLLLVIFLFGSVLLADRSAESAPEPLHALQWEEPERLSTGIGMSTRPVLRVAPNGKLMMAYNSETSSGSQNPFYFSSSDNGLNWSAAAKIRSSNQNLDQITLAFDTASQAHAVWRSNSTTLEHAVDFQWPNTAHPIYTSSTAVWDPYLAIGNDNVLHLVFAEVGPNDNPYDILHTFSTNNGVSWSTPQPITNDSDKDSRVPIVAIDASNNVHMVWEERTAVMISPGNVDTYYEIHYKKGTKNGSNYSWSNTAAILTSGMTRARRPAFIADGNSLHLSFARQISDDTQYPYYMYYKPGFGWSTPVDISNNNPVAVNTSSPFFLITTLTKCSNHIYIYYHGAEILNAKEQAFGASTVDNFETVDIVTTNDARNVNPSLACVGGTLHLGLERIEAAYSNHQIYYAVSRNINKAFMPMMFRAP